MEWASPPAALFSPKAGGQRCDNSDFVIFTATLNPRPWTLNHPGLNPNPGPFTSNILSYTIMGHWPAGGHRDWHGQWHHDSDQSAGTACAGGHWQKSSESESESALPVSGEKKAGM